MPGKKRIFSARRPKEIFLGIGISFAAAAFTLGLFIFVIWGAFLARRLIEENLAGIVSRAAREMADNEVRLNLPKEVQPPEASLPALPAPRLRGQEAGGQLVFASFSDLFSGTGWIDTGRTTMRLDLSASAFTFPLNVSWEEVAGDAGGATDSSRRCIASRCLEARGTQVFLDGDVMTLPASMADSAVVNVSVETFNTKWVLGFVIKEGGGYRGVVFTFDGTRFAPVFAGDGALTSSYAGTLGFGGDDDDWLVVYGAYEGVAYHVREGRAPRDISSFFHMRLMDGGFAPRVLRVENCLPAEALAQAGKLNPPAGGGNCFPTWYVWSACQTTGGRPCAPRLLKLFQNGTAEIRGIVDFSSTFPVRGVTALSLRPGGGGSPREFFATLSFSDRASGQWRFTDYGFDVSESREIVSKNLNTYRAEVPQVVRLNVGTSSLAGSRARFFVSNDGTAWEAVVFDKALAFPDPKGTALFWKAVFDGGTDAALSPFLERVNVDYKVRFTE